MFFPDCPGSRPPRLTRRKACRWPPGRQDGLALLKDVGQQHADAKSCHIEARGKAEFQQRTGGVRRWQKKAVVTPRTLPLRGTVWILSGNVCVGQCHAMDTPREPAFVSPRNRPRGRTRDIASAQVKNAGAISAQGLVRVLVHWADHLNSAALLPEPTISIDGRDIASYVVHDSEAELKTNKQDIQGDRTLWIAKQPEYSEPATTTSLP